MDGRQRRSDSFVVRIWWEEGERVPTWRGWVQHAISGRTHYFQHLADLLTFIELHTGSLAQGMELGSEKGGEGGEIDG